MLDIRPVVHIIGLMIGVLGLLMTVPMMLDMLAGHADWHGFARASFITTLTGLMAAMTTRRAVDAGIGLRQSFLLTASTWAVLPAFGALPFMLGSQPQGWTHAFFESMSGMTTTGTTVLVGLDDMSPGILVWRSMLQWLGGLGIIIVALVFLPVLKVGGMQHFRSEAFDTLGKVLPRVFDISKALLQIYVGLTLLAALVYLALGMSGFDAINHAMTTIATGGFSTSDESFYRFSGAIEYAATVLMILSGLPFIRYIQLAGGSWRPMLQDVQVRAFLRWVGYAIAAIIAYRLMTSGDGVEAVFRETSFNVVTLFTGTGYGSADVESWGDFALMVVIVAGFIGACTASTGCSIKVFRYLVLFEAIKVQMRQLRSPHQVQQVKLAGQPVAPDVISSVIVMFTLFVATFMVLAVLLTLTGLETRTAITAAWTAICNVGPAYGPEVGPTGAVDGFSATAKWLMIAGMYLGRLELLAVLVLFLPRFWRV